MTRLRHSIVVIDIHLGNIVGSRVELLGLHLIWIHHHLTLNICSVSWWVEKGPPKLAHTLLLPVHALRVWSTICLVVALFCTPGRISLLLLSSSIRLSPLQIAI